MTHQNGTGKDVIDGNIEEALDLRSMQIDKESAIGACGGQQVGDKLGADGYARAVLAILAGVPVVGNDCRDPGRRGPLERIDHNKQFHQVLIHRIAGGLHHKNIHAAHVLEQLKVNLAVGKPLQLHLPHRHADMPRHFLSQPRIRRPGKQLEALVLA